MAGEPPPSRWVGFLVIAAGAIPIGAALFADDAKFHAPRWLVAMIGGMFVLAGLMLVRSASAAARPAAADVLGPGLGVLLTSGFTVLSGWALFFSGGPSAWNMSGSLPLWLLGVGHRRAVLRADGSRRAPLRYRALAARGSRPSGPRGLQ